MAVEGTTDTGPEVLVELRRGRGPLRAQLEDALRDAVRGGRLAPGARLPSSRALARDLGVSRRLVVDAYEQLLAEGYLVARRGAGTFVAAGGAARRRRPPRRAAAGATPALRLLPWRPRPRVVPARGVAARDRATCCARRPTRRSHYPRPGGAPALRRALADHLRPRARRGRRARAHRRRARRARRGSRCWARVAGRARHAADRRRGPEPARRTARCWRAARRSRSCRVRSTPRARRRRARARPAPTRSSSPPRTSCRSAWRSSPERRTALLAWARAGGGS